jgi:hypothetical protein
MLPMMPPVTLPVSPIPEFYRCHPNWAGRTGRMSQQGNACGNRSGILSRTFLIVPHVAAALTSPPPSTS